MENLNLKYKIISAISSSDISSYLIKKHYYDWQRPLRQVEIACYYSHRKIWSIVAKGDAPALILEDDAILANDLKNSLQFLENLKGVDYINLESVNRKKLLGRKPTYSFGEISLYSLHIDKNGACGYILYPTGAKKLIDREKYGIGLADVYINDCPKLKAYQLEPASAIQTIVAHRFNIKSPIAVNTNIGNIKKPQIQSLDYFVFKPKRVYAQAKNIAKLLFHIFKSRYRIVSVDRDKFTKGNK